MAVPAWPTSLPQRMEVSGYQEGYGDGRLRSQMDGGPAKVRSRFRPVRPVSGTMMMSQAVLTTLRSFIDDDLDGGTLPFTFPIQGGSGSWLVRFGENLPTWIPSGVPGGWRVTLTLEVLP